MGNLEKKLGEIKYLKQEWDIGTKDAYDYLKSQEELTAFRKHHENEGALAFSNRQITNIADEIAFNVQKFLDTCAEITAFNKESLAKENYVQRIIPSDNLTGFQKGENNLWICDYDSVFSLFLGYYNGFSGQLNDGKAKTIAAFNYTLAKLLFTEIPFLYDINEKPHLVTDIVSDDKLTIHGENSLPDELIDSSAVEDAKEMLQTFGLLGKMELDSCPFVPELDYFSRHEYEYLLGAGFDKDDLYDRAVKELTLKRQDTQRKIALNYLLGLPEEQRTIQTARSKLEKSVEFNLENISKLEQLDAPLPIIDSAKQSFKKKVYLLKSVNTHRKWLEQMLTH